MVITCQEMQQLEQAAFARGVSAESLMDQAGAGIAEVVQQFYPVPGHLVIYAGKGNNAGDAFVAARHLRVAGWKLHVRFTSDPDDLKELPAKHWKSLQSHVSQLRQLDEIKTLRGSLVLLDGLVGLGSRGNLRGELAKAAQEINALRQSHQARVVALDLPSGLDPETGIPGDPCVHADLTITIAYAKTALLQDRATAHVGRLALVPLGELSQQHDIRTLTSQGQLLTAETLRSLLRHRPFDFHKGQAGRVGLIAGSRGYLGAAVLAATGALRAGAGLVTLYAKEEDYPLLASLTPPEVMVRPVADYRDALAERHDALAIGPGLSSKADAEIRSVIIEATCPAVLDAEALNLLARSGLDQLSKAQGLRLLTPHPGEMQRLSKDHPAWLQMNRAELAVDFVKHYPTATLLLKGSRTVIAAKDQPLAYNSTGHPGMASGGMGDVLTGVCAALLASGLSPYDSASLGAWLCGRSAELALTSGGQSEESTVASDVAAHLGKAFRDLARGVY
jgi:ADP-dependent NAD(P)H-hydrate dehydratase / NAD(P)H-hydrate epimerase